MKHTEALAPVGHIMLVNACTYTLARMREITDHNDRLDLYHILVAAVFAGPVHVEHQSRWKDPWQLYYRTCQNRIPNSGVRFYRSTDIYKGNLLSSNRKRDVDVDASDSAPYALPSAFRFWVARRGWFRLLKLL